MHQAPRAARRCSSANRRTRGAAINSTVVPVADGTLGAAVRCHGVRIEALVYAAPGTDPAQATATAQRFIDALAAQCGALARRHAAARQVRDIDVV